MTDKEVYNQILKITTSLIEKSLSDEQTFPSIKNGTIYISDQTDLSVALKNVSYEKIYKVLREQKNYNIMLLDGALLQFMYQFREQKLVKHKLAFFPCPNIPEYQNNEEDYRHDEYYLSITERHITPSPIRIDYDPKNHISVEHSRVHLTIGQYKNCRIPVNKPISPALFTDFILRNFYSTDDNCFANDLSLDTSSSFLECIESEETKVLHLNISH